MTVWKQSSPGGAVPFHACISFVVPPKKNLYSRVVIFFNLYLQRESRLAIVAKINIAEKLLSRLVVYICFDKPRIVSLIKVFIICLCSNKKKTRLCVLTGSCLARPEDRLHFVDNEVSESSLQKKKKKASQNPPTTPSSSTAFTFIHVSCFCHFFLCTNSARELTRADLAGKSVHRPNPLLLPVYRLRQA